VHAAEASQGHIGDAHARASGKVLLAFAAPEVRRRYLDSHPIRRVTAKTKTDRGEIEAELETIRAQGFAEDHEEFAAGLCCIALPFEQGHSPFAVSISAPSDRYAERRDSYLEQLRAAAELGALNS
jgi:IclR family acetate operon transcriptional repressor